MEGSDFSPEQKVKIVLEGLQGKPEQEVCSLYGVTPEQYRLWKEQFIKNATDGFSRKEVSDRGGGGVAPLFGQLVDSIPHAVFAKDLEGKFVYGNAAFCDSLGLTLKELADKDDFAIHTPEAARKYRLDDRAVVESGRVFRCLEQNVPIEGAPIWAQVVKAPIRDEEGKITGVVGMYWDVTEQMNTQKALRESEENLRQLLEHAPSPMGVVTFEGEVIYFNAAFQNVFGYSVEDTPTLEDWWVAACPKESLRKAMKAKGDRFFQGLARGDKGRGDEFLLKGADGEWRYVQATGSALQGKIVVILSDITRLKEAEESLRRAQENLELTVEKRTHELLEANNRLEENSRLKSIFLSSVSHELRTPLTSVLGFAKLINKEMALLQGEMKQNDAISSKHAIRIISNASIIEHEGRRLKRLLDDLLDLSKIESGQMTWQDTEVDLNRLAKQSIKAMQGHFAAKPRVALNSELPHHPVFIKADPDRIQQIFVNLLNNAAKFTDEGDVVVRVRVADGGWAEGCVQDSGPGISEKDIALIFEDFYQGADLVKNDRGTGLGLSISLQIVNHYGGKFWVESERNAGAAFFFRLPLLGAAGQET